MENNIVRAFDNPEFGKVRILNENDEILFCASDVAKALGYTNPNKAVNDHCRAITKRSTPISGKIQKINFIPESDLYRLVLRSKLSDAEKFTDWVTKDVLPSIRKHEMYITPQKTEEILNDPDVLIAALTTLKEEREKRKALEVENEKQKKTIAYQKKAISGQKQLITNMKPKVSYCDLVLKTQNAVPITQIAKDYGMSAVKFNNLLHELKVQYKTNNCWVLYQDYADKGYTKTNTYVVVKGMSVIHTYWTQAGRLFLYNLLKNKCNIVPIMEKE
mgnify:FL=1